jgi:tetratricopeptide (TPR) repeat protein
LRFASPTTPVVGGARSAGLPRRTVAITLVVALAFGVAFGRFAFLGRGETTSESGGDPATLAQLGLEALADARRTGDPSLYARADGLIAASRAVEPDRVETIVASGLLALARHDFAGALRLADEAASRAPTAVDPLAVRVDALVELGRYDEAAAATDEMLARRPNVDSLARGSYLLELRGDRDGALALMQDAVAAARPGSSDLAYVLALLGDLQLGRGRLAAADGAYGRALATQPGQPQALIGRARVQATRGDLAGAAAILERLTARFPLPDAVALHGDVFAARGDRDAATQQYDLVRAIEELNRSTGGIAVDLELARFEVGQIGRPGGDAARAVAQARAARDARPTIFADDILAWALRGAGDPAAALPLARAAVRLGTADATLWWHLAAVEADLGNDADARAHLQYAFDLGGPLPLLERSEALRLADRLRVSPPAPAS